MILDDTRTCQRRACCGLRKASHERNGKNVLEQGYSHRFGTIGSSHKIGTMGPEIDDEDQ